MMNFTSSPLFQIRLEEDTLTMHGSQTESVGCVLRGQLVLAITEPTKFKEISMSFQGKSKVRWSDDGEYCSEEKIIYQHDWTFLPANKHYHLLNPDNYYWDFELVLPGTLPETIEGYQNGSVKYILKAVAERHSFALLNLHTQRKVTLKRSLFPDSLEYFQAVVLSNTWENKIHYEFSMDSKVFGLGDKIPVTIRLKSLVENFKLQEISCIFKEIVTCTFGENHKTDSKVVEIANLKNFSQLEDSWNHRIEISIPDNPAYCLYDSHNDIIDINHKLTFCVAFVNKVNNRSLQLKVNLPIKIISSTCYIDDMNLPAYDEDKSYIEDSSSQQRPSSCSSIQSLHEIEGMNKVPSYRNSSSFIPVPLSDHSLPPTYHSSINSH